MEQPLVSLHADRIAELRAAAVPDGYALREDSVPVLEEFLQAAPYEVRRAGLALASQGDINAVWVSEDRKRRLSIQFFGDGTVEYVMLSPDDAPEMDRVAPKEFWTKFSQNLHDFLTG